MNQLEVYLMDDNKKDNNDFFKPHPQNNNDNEEQSKEQPIKQDRPSYYYSYGPYKSAFQENQEEHLPSSTSVTGSNGTSPVEVIPPKLLRPLDVNPDSGPSGAAREWDSEKKKRSSARSVFAAFMAGAVVVATLMFSADKMNLFTGNQPLAASSSASSSTSTPSGNNSGNVKSAALDLNRPTSISQIYNEASPAVVKIEALVKPKVSSRSGSGGIFNDPFFRQFFGDNAPGGGGSGQNNGGGSDTLQPVGMGTGFLFEKSGYILTNEHVVDGADEIQVTVQGYDKPFTAKLLGNSYDLDLAALKIDGDKDFPILPLGKAEDVNVGDWVVAIGNPYGFDHTVTVGVLSSKERPISIPDSKGTREYKHLLQTDASINPGNSGGPLLNLSGEVIGINTAVSAQAQGIGFAIPTSTISSVLDNLKNNVTIPKEPIPYLGVGLQDIDSSWVTELKLKNTDGAIVGTVDRKTPAFQAGVRPYDVIVEMNGAKVKNSAELIAKVKTTKVGDKLTLGIIRDGNRSDISVQVGDKNLLNQQQQQQ
jgi:serine protease Do